MKRTLFAGVIAGVALAAGGFVATNPPVPSLPDVQVPAVELSSAEGVDATVAWLDLFTQTSGGSAGPLAVYPQDFEPGTVTGDIPLVVIPPQNSAQEFDKILDGVIGKVGSQLNGGPDAVTYLIGSNAP